MKNSVKLLALCVMTFSFAQETEESRSDLQVGAGIGQVAYEERVSIIPVVSEWDAAAGYLHLKGHTQIGQVQPYGELRYTSSLLATEKWRENGFLVQENDMRLVHGALRVGLKLPLSGSRDVQLVPRVGVIVSIDEFTRDKFFFLVEDATLFNVNQEVVETVTSAGFTAGFTWEVPLNDTLAFLLDSEVAWLGTVEAENDGFNVTLDGADGWKWSGNVSLVKQLNAKDQFLSVTLRADVQEINGVVLEGMESNLEYPDNTLEFYAVEVAWTSKF